MTWRILGLAMTWAAVVLGAAPAGAITIYPIDRAQILAGSRFDLKVEFDGVLGAADAKVTIDGTDLSTALGRPATFVEREAGVAASALLLRDVSLTKPGRYAIVASDGKTSRTVGWEVYGTGPRKARNVILFKQGTVTSFPEQPDLVDMVKTALTVLARHEDGFVLLVESGLIDKYSHPLDWERAVMDTIMLDRAVAVAKEFAGARNDTLIMVTADHTHGLSLVGTVDDSVRSQEMRDRIGVHEKAGYPNYPPANDEGYPPRLDVSRRLAIFFSVFPDYYETYRPKLDGPFVPAVGGPDKSYVANEKYKDTPGAVLRVGNLPHGAPQGVHSGEDVLLTATGPGAERVRGFLDNTEVFRIVVDALGLAAAPAQ